MAKGVFTTSNSYYINTSISTLPITMSSWVYRTAATGSGETVIALSADSGSIFSRMYGWYIRGYLNSWRATTRSDTTLKAASVSDGFTADKNKWTFICAVFASDSERTIYYWDGSTMGTSTNTDTLAPPLTKDRLGIGTCFMANGGSGDVFDIGYLSRASFWNIDLSSAEVNMLARGCSPLNIRPDNLVSYVPLVREARNIVSGGLSLSEKGTVPHRHDEPPAQIYSSLPHSL